jgi:hypothetical protein
LRLAKCVVTTLQSNGKIGTGSGLVMHQDSAGKVHIERRDKDFIEALAYIGISAVQKKSKEPRRRAAALGKEPT